MVFEDIMSKELGDIDYNTNEYLNLGASGMYTDCSKFSSFLISRL